MNRLRGSARGQVFVLFCLGMAILIGFMALAVDVGLLWTTRRQMQTAADAAAVAAAEALKNGYGSANMTAAGKNAAALNSFTDGQNNATVTINNPPLYGSNNCANNPANCNSYVEAIVDQPQTTYFLNAFGYLLGVNYTTIDVSTRAVGGSINGIGDGGLVTLDTSSSNNNGLTVSGGSTLSTGAGIIVDSSNSSALNVSSSTVDAASVGVVGNVSGTTSPPAKTGIAAVPDPLAYLPAPTCGGSACNAATVACTYTNVSVPCNKGQTLSATTEQCVNNPPSGSQTPAPTSYTLAPGVYCNGITVNGNGISATFNSGLYVVLGGGLNIKGGANGSGAAVTFFNTGNSTYQYKPFVISASSSSMSAPTSGGDTTAEACPSCTQGYEGILFWQDPKVCLVNSSFCGANGQQNTISGGSSTSLVGAIYLPNTPLVYSGGSASAAYTIIVADTVTISGGSTTYLNSNTSSNQDGSPIRQSALYE